MPFVRSFVTNAYLSGIGVTGLAVLSGCSAARPPKPRVSQIVFLSKKNFTPSREMLAAGAFCLLVNLINVPRTTFNEVQLSLQVLLQHVATLSGYQYRVMHCTGWAKLNEANTISFVVVKHVLENFANF